MPIRSLLFPLILGIAGCAVLISLGVWQLRRLEWKGGVLAEIEARIAAAPVSLPANPDPEEDRYVPVSVTGRTTGDELLALVSTRSDGAGYRLISAFQTDGGRRIMVDEGFIRLDEKDVTRPTAALTVTGNLHWPDETDGFTPDPDLANRLIFARDVGVMARILGTEPVLVVARDVDPPGRAAPIPVGTEGIPNDHLGYAIQWFGLALVWAGMTLFLLWRIRNRTN
jgi:surfeit locus 1 family protein